jgi:two-component system, NarL family, invasion response regulator UvrY
MLPQNLPHMNNLLLIDDHEVIRSAVKILLQDIFKPADIFEAHDEQSAALQLKARPYRLIISDVKMPGSQPYGLTEYIMTHYPGSKVLIFSMNEEHIYAKKFLQSGAMGFVSKNADLPELRKAIDMILNGRKYISDTLSQQLAGMLNKDQSSVNPFEKLSRRELEISSLMIQGLSVIEIAKTLTIAQSTVGTYKTRIMQKLNVKNLVELIELGKANGL